MNSLIIKDKKNNILNRYPSDCCDLCLVSSDKCTHNKLMLQSEYNERIYCFCFDQIKNKNQGKFLIKNFPIIVDIAQRVKNDDEDFNSKASDVVVHNTKNLLAQLNAKIERYTIDSVEKDYDSKFESLISKIKSNIGEFTHEFFNFARIVSQLMSEYSIIDLLKVDSPFPQNKRNGYKIHSLLMQTYYHYEREFRERELFLDIEKSDYRVNIEFRSIKTALSQFYDNLLKYALPKQDIHIEFSVEESLLLVSFHMKSLYLTDIDIVRMCCEGHRGEYALKSKVSGNGFGCFIINHLIYLNSGYFKAERLKDLKIRVEGDDNTYSHNKLIIALPLK